MNDLDKVEKLRQRANVTYEEAADALKACDGDLLDAMVYLEKLGKVKAPNNTVYTTNYDEQTKYQDVTYTVEESKKADERTLKDKIKHLVEIIAQKRSDNSLRVERHGKEILVLPLWVVALILLFAWYLTIAVVIVSLFLDCRYTLEGKDDMTEANNVMGKATDAADYVKREFDKL